MTFGSLFAGIGGFDLGLECAGMRCEWQVEIDPYARRVLERHWPNVRRWDDVRTFPPPGDWGVDRICGGFPCQDISNAGKRAGINGEQSGLWNEFSRAISLLRPRYIIVENVSALLGRGMGQVLGDLSTLGYDAEWEVIPASAFGAPHIRERVWILAYPNNQTESSMSVNDESWARVPKDASQVVSYTMPKRCNRRHGIFQTAKKTGRVLAERDHPWTIEPNVDRVAYGIPYRVDRIKTLGNAVVPQCAEWIGRQILLMDCY